MMPSRWGAANRPMEKYFAHDGNEIAFQRPGYGADFGVRCFYAVSELLLPFAWETREAIKF
jgi:hypothetical protein